MAKTKDLTPERLKARLGDIHCTGPVNGTAAGIVGQALRRIESLERENARLRYYLRAILESDDARFTWPREMAREALA